MMNKKQTLSIVLLLLLCIGLMAALFMGKRSSRISPSPSASGERAGSVAQQEKPAIIQADGDTLKTRICVPEGYQRTKAGKDSLTAFLRNYAMKEDGSPVRFYNGKKKGNQGAHAAVFDLPIEKEDLQQCADSIMRVYAEYYWNTGQYDKIAFHFVDGFLAEYGKWRQGYRIQVSDSGTSWTKSAEADNSYGTFQSYLRIVFSYASTLSMEKESDRIALSQIRPGDILIKGGSPGHVVMVVDVCKDGNGKKAFLLAQGFMPAQEFHLLNNPLHGEDPWYYQEEITWPLSTPEYIFDKKDLMRPGY